MAKPKRKGIRRSIENIVIPELLARGFVADPKSIDAVSSPFGLFQRVRDGGVDMIEFSFNKYRGAQFKFHIARAVVEKTVFGNAVPLELQQPYQVEPNFAVWRRGRLFRHWYGVRKFAREGISDEEYDAAARQSLESLKPIDRYFSHGSRTLAMEKFPQGWQDDLTYRGFCAVVVLGSLGAVLWSLGWLWRQF